MKNFVLTEIERVMNSRSLTNSSEEEYQKSLTPNHLPSLQQAIEKHLILTCVFLKFVYIWLILFHIKDSLSEQKILASF